ncbi:hypothetical protein D3C87_2053900 [compost metagenome]
MDFLVNGIHATLLVTYDSPFLPAVPQLVAGFEKLSCHFITLGVRRQIVTAEVTCRVTGE